MAVAKDGEGSAVNSHYLGHVVKVSEKHTVEASEDIVAGNGMKLLARGARIDGRVKDRLLEHKLRKPLEDCMRVSDGVVAADIALTAEALLSRHPMLRALYANSRHAPVPTLLKAYDSSAAMQSLFTVYAKHDDAKLEHTVGVSLMSMGLAKKLTPYDSDRPNNILLAGMYHDVGELYIAPEFVARGTELPPEQWRHVAAHPIVSHRVLKGLNGVSPAVANIVLHHHERLDGFGYPQGTGGDKMSTDSQILAVGELLSGLLEASSTPLTHADIALRLIPGEFSRAVVDVVSSARKACEAHEVPTESADALARSLPRVARIATLAQRVAKARAALQDEVSAASDMFKTLLKLAEQRLQTVLRAFSSTGLDAPGAGELVQRLQTLGDAALTLEFTLIVRETDWRLRELERELTLRVQGMTPHEAPLLARLLAAVKERQLH